MEMKESKKTKSKEEILNQLYITADDLKTLIPTLGINRCLEYISEARIEMELKGYFVPQTKPFLALTKIIKKKFGF